jgi:LacI family transcriptional regulator
MLQSGLAQIGASDPMKRLITGAVIDRDLPQIELDTVICNNRHGGYLATKHLLDLGHRRIGCLAGLSIVSLSAERLTGYRMALEEAGVPVDDSLIMRGDFRPEAGMLAAQAFFDMPSPPTAIFACNDLMAMGVLRAAAESNRRVPEDLSLVGFDDIELASYAIPPLTTIAQPKQEIGQTAVRLLLERIEKKRQDVKRVILPTSLTIRQSSARAPDR